MFSRITISVINVYRCIRHHELLTSSFLFPWNDLHEPRATQQRRIKNPTEKSGSLQNILEERRRAQNIVEERRGAQNILEENRSLLLDEVGLWPSLTGSSLWFARFDDRKINSLDYYLREFYMKMRRIEDVMEEYLHWKLHKIVPCKTFLVPSPNPNRWFYMMLQKWFK